MKHYRWFLALGIWLALLPGTSGAGPNHGPVQVVSTRIAGDDEGNTQPSGTGDYGSDVGVGWYAVGASGAASSIDDILLTVGPSQGAGGHSTHRNAHEEAAAWLLRRVGH